MCEKASALYADTLHECEARSTARKVVDHTPNSLSSRVDKQDLLLKKLNEPDKDVQKFLEDIRKSDGPTTEFGKNLLVIIEPTGKMTAQEALKTLENTIGRAESVAWLDNLAGIIKSLTPKQLQAFGQLLKPNEANYLNRLCRGDLFTLADQAEEQVPSDHSKEKE